MWLDHSVIGDVSNIPSQDLLPVIKLPLTNTGPAIIRLVSALKLTLKHNYYSSLTIAGRVMAMHYTHLVRLYKGCPIVYAVGPSETSKSTSIRAACSRNLKLVDINI